VLVPLPPLDIDPGRAAEAALPLARTLAQRTGAPLTLLSVLEPAPPFNPLTRMATPTAPGAGTSPVAETEARLAGLAAAVPACPGETVVRTGSPAEQIRSVVAEHSQPLLVLCSHTRTGLDRLLYGSITGELVHTATCPVLVVRGRQPAASEGVAPLHTVVVPFDQSALAEQALARALTALGPADLHLHLLHVLEPPPGAAQLSRDQVAYLALAIERDLETMAQRLRSQGYRVTTEVRAGRPADEIAQAAIEQGAQLIAMATHGKHGVDPVLLGSVAERLLQTAPVPLLLVRPAGRPETHDASTRQHSPGRAPSPGAGDAQRGGSGTPGVGKQPQAAGGT
jgi:nucleotide-binding universal stress UspA family protein